MKFRNKTILLLLLSTSVGISTINIKASITVAAKRRIAVVSRHRMRPTTYKLKRIKSKNTYAYSARLTQKKFRLATYSNKSFNVTHQEKLRVNGKYRIYYFAKNLAKPNVTGWIWRGYLTKTTPSPLSKTALNRLIASSPDLDPNNKILKLNPNVYRQFAKTFDKQYNVGNFAFPGLFFHDHATIYVENSPLQTVVSAAISKWNTALGADVFSLGNKGNSTLTIRFGNGSDAGWDGLFDGFNIQVDQKHFSDNSYVSSHSLTPRFKEKIRELSAQASQLLLQTNNELSVTQKNFEAQSQHLNAEIQGATSDVQRAQLQQQLDNLKANYQAADQQIKHDYNSQIEQIRQQIKADYQSEQGSSSDTLETNYWITVVTHELGHTLGLYHTPYQSDIMYAPTDNESESTLSPVKYSWNSPKDPNSPKASETATLSTRDIDRAKLTKLLGYW
ncbi:matrixin family metalloprotease [Lentilactobacillus kisonensis]|uniref:Peptidase M10 metallopeptidase domain-containing protein n=1 Tax=Lentilactobacillus kisonensis F0435 TaxID=797516 RepID=H1LK00_9LACO|nr:matrixin family metalloprotease [Lentilactobacillus kisonensis]EHO47940.1 hypothetical protein HMPREF9104_02943 [Lentilactobacillus kisonensis F0435]